MTTTLSAAADLTPEPESRRYDVRAELAIPASPDTVSLLVDLALAQYDAGSPAVGRVLMDQAADVATRLRDAGRGGWGVRTDDSLGGVVA